MTAFAMGVTTEDEVAEFERVLAYEEAAPFGEGDERGRDRPEDDDCNHDDH